MPYKLISLVFLLFILIINKSYSKDEFILPAKKPSIFKKIEKVDSLTEITNLPQKKPIIETAETEKINIKKEELKTKKKTTNIEKKEVKKNEIVL